MMDKPASWKKSWITTGNKDETKGKGLREREREVTKMKSLSNCRCGGLVGPLVGAVVGPTPQVGPPTGIISLSLLGFHAINFRSSLWANCYKSSLSFSLLLNSSLFFFSLPPCAPHTILTNTNLIWGYYMYELTRI